MRIKLTKYSCLVFFILSCLFTNPLFSQQPADSSDGIRICYTHYMSVLNAGRFDKNNLKPFAVTANDNGTEFLVVPVVVHVIHDSGTENISDKVILSQIDVLNEDFGNYGPLDNDGRAVDTRIRFCLAKIDPDGNPTSGIIRIQSAYTDMQSNNEMLMKNLSRWDQRRYFNIWIVRSIDGASGIQGYSYLPSETGGPGFSGDGLVLVAKFVGRFNPLSPASYNRGRTAVHESGHYLDMLHTWGHDDPGRGGCNDDDGIDDTPVCSLAYYSAPPVCPHPLQCGNTRMIENYLDYSYDLCMKIFTEGQKMKMRSSLLIYRSTLTGYNNLSSCGCSNLYDSLNATAAILFYPNPTSDFQMNFRVYNRTASDMKFSMYDLMGRKLKDFNLKGISVGIYNISFEGVRPGAYILHGQFLNQAFRQKIIISN